MYAEPIQELIDALGRLPGIGPKSAQRIAFHLLAAPPEDAKRLSVAIDTAKARVRFCDRCFNLAESSLCDICRDPRRTDALICVVEDPRDVVAVERTGEFSGRYHVLHGCINPIEGIGPDQLRIGELLSRIDAATTSTASPEAAEPSPTLLVDHDVDGAEEVPEPAAESTATVTTSAHGEPDPIAAVEEVIVCTNPTIEGEATAMYLARLLSPLNVAVSRLASGLPVGGDLEYADEVTLGRALIGRRVIETNPS